MINSLLLNTYSTTEYRIGTYLGKPLYRKVFIGTTDTNHHTWFYNQNIGILVNSGGRVKIDSNYSGQINTSFGGTADNDLRIVQHSTNFVLQTGSNYRGKDYQLWIEYTKTTD